MISYKSFGLILFIIGLIGCGTSTEQFEKIETIDYRSDSVGSANLSLTIPSGWKEIDDNKEKIFDIWLVNEENNASICFIPIHLDKRFNEKSDADKHSFVVDLLLNKKRSTASDFEVVFKQENFRNNITTIRYITDGNLQNSIIFGKGELFYECLAYSDINSNLSQSDLEEIFIIQNEIVNTSQNK